MKPLVVTNTFNLENALSNEHTRLVRFCARFTGNPDAAEDLAQETMIEAWRHAGQLHDPTGYAKWLNAIARNVCLRWLRETERPVLALDKSENLTADDFDLSIDLERDELVVLLDRALGLLPPDTRDLLVAKYVHDSPLAEIAGKLNLKPNALAVRLHRGKLALKQVLETALVDDAATFGILPANTQAWTETRIWCTLCGVRHLQIRRAQDSSEFAVRCPSCHSGPDLYFAQSSPLEAIVGIKSPRPLLNRFSVWMDEYLRTALSHDIVPCRTCNSPTIVRRTLPDHAPSSIQHLRGVYVKCTQCTASSYATLDGVAFNVSAVRAFWRKHPRMQTLPITEMVYQNKPALTQQFRATDSTASVQIILDATTYLPLAAVNPNE